MSPRLPRRSLAPLLLALLAACGGGSPPAAAPTVEGVATLGPEGGSVSLSGVARVSFPAGAFAAPQEVRVVQGPAAPNDELFRETGVLFSAGERLAYEVRVAVGPALIGAETFEVELEVPAPLAQAVPAGQGLYLYALVRFAEGADVEDAFRLMPSFYDAAAAVVTASLPRWVLTDAQSAGAFEAVLLLAAGPGENGPAGSGRARAPSSPGCASAGIGLPVALPSGALPPVSSAFGSRTDPITGQAGAFHHGVDLSVPVGTPVMAVADGYIERVRNQFNPATGKGWGWYVDVRHSDGSATRYAHLSPNSPVWGGQPIAAVGLGTTFSPTQYPVTQGQVIGLSGQSGGVSGPHLHFEYAPNGQLYANPTQVGGNVDPLPCLTNETFEGSIVIGDNGPAADDAFAIFLYDAGGSTLLATWQTPVLTSREYRLPISGLRPGVYFLRVQCTDDGFGGNDVGTLGVTLNDGLAFDDGSTAQSAYLDLGASATYTLVVPAGTGTGRARSAALPPSAVRVERGR